MVEFLEEILKGGFDTWKNNLKIGIPFLISTIISFVFVIGALILGVILLLGLFSTGFSSLSTLNSQIAAVIQANIMSLLIMGIVFCTIFFTILLLINSFFEAGAVGMAKEATETGKTTIDDMINYGRRKYLSLFFAKIIVFLIVILGSFVIGGIFIGIPALLMGFSTDAIWSNTAILLLLILSVCILLIFFLITSIVFIPVTYALVVSNLGAVESVKKGYLFFMQNKLYVFLLWFIIFILSIFFSVGTSIIQIPLEYIPVIGDILSLMTNLVVMLISAVVIAPLTAIWWTRLYMDKKNDGGSKSKKGEEKKKKKTKQVQSHRKITASSTTIATKEKKGIELHI